MAAWRWRLAVLGSLSGCAEAHGPQHEGVAQAWDAAVTLTGDAGASGARRRFEAGVLPGGSLEVQALPPSGPLEAGAAPALVAPEVCNGRDDDGDGRRDEGCPIWLAEGRTLQLVGGRLLWLEVQKDFTQELWTVRLPDGAPELLTEGSRVYAATDGERVVFSDEKMFGYVLRDMRDGSRRLIKPTEPRASNLLQPALFGEYVAFSQDLRITHCGGWCDETEVYLHDLRSGVTQVIAPGPDTIQTRPLLGAGLLVWMDDRLGHHIDEWGGAHWFDVWAAALPYDGSYRRLTFANPRSIDLVGFSAGRLLTVEEKQPGLRAPQLLEVASGRVLALDAALAQGDQVLGLSETHLLVRAEPLGSCALRLIAIEGASSVELETDGACPTQAVFHQGFVAWQRPAGAADEIYWMDVRDDLGL